MKENKSSFDEDWWTKSQIALVKDDSIFWERGIFKSVPGFWIQKDGHKILGKVTEHGTLPPGAIIDNTAWDHEHCELCFTKISEYHDNLHDGYTNGKEWLCPECYDKYIAPKIRK